MTRPTFLPLLLLMLSPILHAQMVIIASPELKIDHISRADVHDIFTGAALELTSGTRVKPVLLKPCPAHDEFLANFIGEKTAQFRQDWMSLLFAGKMLLPPNLSSEAEVVEYVAHHVSSIGYIHKTSPTPAWSSWRFLRLAVSFATCAIVMRRSSAKLLN